jgi:hypothetical protein
MTDWASAVVLPMADAPRPTELCKELLVGVDLSRQIMTRTDRGRLSERIAEEFGLPPDQVTDELLVKLGEDPEFVYHLDVCKSDPEMLRILLNEAQPTTPNSRAEPTSIEVVVRAGVALAKWARSGFGRVDRSEYLRRLSICNSCEHLSAAPDSLPYKLVASAEAKSICGLCGCDVRRKAWLATEECPDPSEKGGRWMAAQQ